MNPTSTYLRSELVRTVRNGRYLAFAIAMPVLLVLVWSATDDGSTLDGLRLAPYIMVSMATFGAMTGVFSTSGRIATERSIGWNRQLRLTALSGRAYVLGKVTTGFTVALPAMVAVFLVSALAEGVRLSPARWVAIAASVLLALLPVCALGIWLGYLVRADNVQSVSGGIYSLLGLLGGVWVPLTIFPHWVQDVAEALPFAWAAEAGRDALQGSWVGVHGLVVLVAWTLVLGLLAARAYERDVARA